MSLWGSSSSDESKPKNLTTAEKKEVFASAKGWVREAGSILSGNDNTSATPEVLVALRGLAVKLGAADITEITFVTTAFAPALLNAVRTSIIESAFINWFLIAFEKC